MLRFAIDRGQMVHGTNALHRALDHIRVGDVALDDLDVVGQELPGPLRGTGDDPHGNAVRDERPDQMPPRESGGAGHERQGSHRCLSRCNHPTSLLSDRAASRTGRSMVTPVTAAAAWRTRLARSLSSQVSHQGPSCQRLASHSRSWVVYHDGRGRACPPPADRADAPRRGRRGRPGIYIRKLCEALFELDSQNQYVAYYWRPDQVGRFADHPNVREVVVPGRNKLAWDQVLVPLAARRDLLDVLFHHKFSIPLLAPCPTVVQQRGTEYWSHPEFYTGWSGRVDRLYSRFMIPLYCRRAVRVLTNSDTLGEELVRYVGVPRNKLRTVYASADRSFRSIADSAALAVVRARYGLPQEPFLLMVVKGHQVVGQASGRALTPRKNVALAIEGYGRMRARPRGRTDASGPRDPGSRHRRAAHSGGDRRSYRSRRASHARLRGVQGYAGPLQHGAGAGVSLALRELRHPHRGGDGLRLPGDHRDDLRLSRGRG